MPLSTEEYANLDKKIRDTGFFSEYLPPCFQLNSDVFHHLPGAKCDLIPPYNFNMSRFNQMMLGERLVFQRLVHMQ